jgi:lipid-binding SYLF domain-containing protein
MKRILVSMAMSAVMALTAATALADKYDDTVQLFKNAGQSATFFDKSYGYAVFPSIGKGGLIVGGAHGTGRVFAQGEYVGDTSTTQVSVGLQAGGQAYSMIIFFEDRRAFDEFTRGDFAFGAGVSAVAITAAAGGSTGTMGTTGGASGGKNDAATAGGFHKGMAVFTIVKGGAMGSVAVGGQKFSYKPRAS